MAVLALFSFRGCEGIDREWPIVRRKKRGNVKGVQEKMV